MGHTFGVFGNSQGGITFAKMKAQLVEDATNPNHPDNPDSPNNPRVERYPGYKNPILGDPGKGRIGRWQEINIDALETVIDQIIEQYLKDRTWYSRVRCREALWNMYRRLDWWVKQQIDPTRNDYQRAVQMIKDCINHILEEAQDPELAHNVSLPLCPAPYYHSYHGDYFNHYDGQDVEVPLFRSQLDIPLSDDFPGHFRYVSSSEDQEWQLVHSVGSSESTGAEMILKLPINRLHFGNSSKITFNWRFKKRGFIRFKYLASASPGNGLTFFVNNNQVGGEWNRNTGWQEARFNVQPGQTYKFDWLIRRQSEVPFGQDAVYIKDVECIEVIRSLEAPTPPDFDTLGNAAYQNGDYDWITYSKSSVIRTHFDGVVNDGNRSRELSIPMGAECDGSVSFAYRMGETTPTSGREYYLMFDDDLISRTQSSNGRHGSSGSKTGVDSAWVGNRSSFSTKADAAKINYELVVGEECTVDIRGTLEIICPPLEIDHYEPSVIQTTGNASWSVNGAWASGSGAFVLNNPTGNAEISTSVTLVDDGWFTFTYSHDFRPSESLEVLVDGQTQLYSVGANGRTVTIPLLAGTHYIVFRVNDLFVEQPVYDYISKKYLYGAGSGGGSFTTEAPYGSKATITRNWEVIDGSTRTFDSGKTITHAVTLQPGAKFRLDENVRFMSNPNLSPGSYFTIVNEDFNEEGVSGEVFFSSAWEWEDILTRQNQWAAGDGVFKVEGVPGEHRASAFVNATSGGFVTFEYGGKFGGYDYVELLAGGQQIWKGNSSHGTEPVAVKVPIPAGNYELAWVYHCKGGGVITIPPDTETPTNPGNEVCFAAGSETTSISYPQAESRQVTARSSIISWSGEHFYTGPSGHGAESDGAIFSRTFKAPSFGSISFAEKLRVSAGNNTPVDDLYEADVFLSSYRQNRMYQNGAYYALDVNNVQPPGQSGWLSNNFHTNGDISLSFDYLTYIVDPENAPRGQNKSGRSTKYRAEFNVWLVPVASGSATDPNNLVLQQIENVGPKQRIEAITNWSGAKTFNKRISVPKGYYYILFSIMDAVGDSDKDDEGYWYYAAMRNLKIKVTDTRMNTSYDSTKVKVELINRSTNQIVTINTYGTNGNASADYNISFYGLTPGTPYQVRYTLIKGTGTTGGTYGNGGAMVVSNGQFMETWAAYCTSNGNYYPKSQSTQQPPQEGTTVQVPLTPGAWAWLDAIMVKGSNASICSDTQVSVTISNGSTIIDQSIWNQFSPTGMFAEITNNTTQVQTYLVTQTFSSSCGAGAMLTDGRIRIDDVLLPRASFVAISGYSVTNNKAIWIGGCDGSTITATVTDDAGNIVSRQVFSGGGVHDFSVSDLPNQPYSKYRLQFDTDQKGIISQHSGKPYMTEFRLVDLKMYEDWINVPDPFNGKLEFFIDGNLMGTYTNSGNGFTTVTHPIPKGNHNLKWVFTELGTGNVYDKCEIDFLKVTNWICDRVKVVPYCVPGGGDICVEELIKCLLRMWNARPKACVIGKTVWLFT